MALGSAGATLGGRTRPIFMVGCFSGAITELFFSNVGVAIKLAGFFTVVSINCSGM